MRSSIFASLAALALISPALHAQEEQQQRAAESRPEKPPVQLNERERAFVDLLTKSVLVGHFSVQGKQTPPGKERYAISSVAKLGDDRWLVVARITYGNYDLPVPVPVTVLWAGDTPVLQVTDLTIPGLGEGFTSRVLFYGERYAGTWQHGQVGGNMWGTIEKTDGAPDQQQKPQPNPSKPDGDR